jgi:hypothetical protein
MAAALDELGRAPEGVIGIGDAEHDQAFSQRAACPSPWQMRFRSSRQRRTS